MPPTGGRAPAPGAACTAGRRGDPRGPRRRPIRLDEAEHLPAERGAGPAATGPLSRREGCPTLSSDPMTPREQEALIEAAVGAYRALDAGGRLVPPPDWWDLAPELLDEVHRRQTEA